MSISAVITLSDPTQLNSTQLDKNRQFYVSREVLNMLRTLRLTAKWRRFCRVELIVWSHHPARFNSTQLASCSEWPLRPMGVDPWVDRETFRPSFWSGGDFLCFVPLFFGIDISALMRTIFIGRLEQFSSNLVG